MADEMLTIGELSRRTGVATSALRYYDDLRLLRPAARVSGHRRYPPDAVGAVGTILFLRDVGFTLDEIRRLLAARWKSRGAWHELARRKIVELDERIADARAARVAVEHALACPHDDIVACPNFQEVVRRRLAGTPLRRVHTHPTGTDTSD
jgi:DNA-binding transcriptional MerR regulator